MAVTNFVTNQDIILLLAQRIKEYRLAARLSQREMAEKSGVGMAYGTFPLRMTSPSPLTCPQPIT